MRIADPDNPPLSAEQLASAKKMPRIKIIRRALKLTQEEFSACYHIPLGTLRRLGDRAAANRASRPAPVFKVIAVDPAGTAAALRKRQRPRPFSHPIKSNNNFTFSAAMTMAMNQANAESHRGAHSSPILARSAVNMTSGKTAKESCRFEHHLRQDKKLSCAAVAEGDGDTGGRDDGDAAGDEAQVAAARGRAAS